MKAVFVDTHKMQNAEIKKAILEVMAGTSEDNPMTVTRITEELRSALPYTTTCQRVNYILFRTLLINENKVKRNTDGFYYIIKK